MDHNVLFQQLISSSPPHSHMDIAKIDFKVKIKPPMKMSTATKGKRPMRHLTASDKIEAIQRIHDGESKASVARDIGVPESTLRGWCKNEDKLRYMSRQSTPDSKMDKLTEDAVAAGLLGQLGPPEKRPKMDTSLPLNFATNGGKLKYDDLGPYKSRPSLNGLDLSSNSDLNGLSHSDFSAFAKSAKGYGADLSKPQDPTKSDMSMAAISPLTSLSHLSGMSSLGQSPLALSFNEIATNLNLIAQFNNPNLAAMSGLNQLNTSTQALRNVRPKTTSVSSNLSPRSSNNNNNNNTIDQDKLNQGLTVKNLSKLQKNDPMGLNLSEKNKKLQTQIPTINRDAPVDDALWYWLKSQQAMLGLNNLYSSITQQNNNNNMSNNNNLNSSNSNLLNSPQSNMSGHHMHHQTPPQPQQQQIQQPPPQHHPSQTPTPPIVSSPQITPPSSTPSAASDDTKNSSWFWQWYKTFGSSLLDKQNTINNNNQMNSNNNGKIQSYENILYSQLTKGAPLSDSLAINNNNNITHLNNNNLPKPEDLSQHSNNNIININNNNNSHIISNSHNISHNNSLNISNDNLSLNTSHNNHLNHNGSHIDDDNHSDHENGHDIEMNNSENNIPNDLSSSSSIKREDLDKSPGKVRAALDDLLFNNNNNNTNNNNNINNSNSSNNSNLLIESNDNINNNNNNNNNNDIKSESDSDSEISSPLEAVEHGEKFLKWLETYSDPSITAMQVMQFRYLLNTIKTSADRANNPTPVNEERIKIRRRK